MSVQGFSSQGTTVARSLDPLWPPTAPVGGSVSFSVIAELRDITPPSLTRNELETTTQNNADDAYLVGIRRHGPMQFNCNFVPKDTTHDFTVGFQYSWFNGLRDIWKITFPDTTQWLFSGFITNISPHAPVDGVLTADVTVRPTGKHQII